MSDASGMQLLDVPGRCWSEEILETLSIDRNLLGTVYESCQITGTLLPEIADRVGLTRDVKVVGGAGDNAAAAVGTGVVRDQFCQDYMAEAKRQGRDVYDLINEDISLVPAGSERLLYLPYLMGERTPHLDPDCRGVFFGLSTIHTRRHLLRAVMEGVSYSLCDCNDILREMGIQVTRMMACGGGGKSPVWRQMLANLYDCTVTTVRQEEGPALGAAILAGVGCGIYPSVEEACDRLISEKSSTGPHAGEVKIYADYHRLYQSLYRSLKQNFRDLAGLEGV